MHRIISKNKGKFNAETQDFQAVKSFMKEISSFKDIPNQAKLELANCFIPRKYKKFEIIMDIKNKDSMYFMLDGEAKIKENRQYQDFTKNLSRRQTFIMRRQSIQRLDFNNFLDMIQDKDFDDLQKTDKELIREEKEKEDKEAGEEEVCLLNNKDAEDEAAKEKAKKSDRTIITDLEPFGNSYVLTGLRWRPCYVVSSRNETHVLEMKVSQVDKLLQKINNSESHKALIAFLSKNIVGFDKISAVARDKVARCTVEKVFYPGSILIKEGTEHNFAYIIQEGDCILKSTKDP